ncbi:Hairy/enhancer-of-split related with YRPW motif protein 1-like protein, partial [Leptotrombidium deliense]
METIAALDHDLDNFNRKKGSRDPLSHRVIEKRRRDRMNKCLQDLGRLIPQQYMKKSKSRIEKTEIVEMAIKHLKHLSSTQKSHSSACREECRKQYQLGFQECMSETIRFLVEMEEMSFKDGLCMRIVSHLQNHVSKLNHFDTMIQKPQINNNNNLITNNNNIYEQSTYKMSQIELGERKPSFSEVSVKSSEVLIENYTERSSPTTTSSTSPIADEFHSRNKYKFKQNMKERFQADVQKNDWIKEGA